MIIGNLKSNPEPNIHLLYMEIEREKQYQPRIYKAVWAVFLPGGGI